MHSGSPPPSRYVLAVPRHLTRGLLGCIAILLALHIGFQWARFHNDAIPWELQALFDFDQEQSVPTWFSAAMLGFAALLLAVISGAKRAARDRDTIYWTGLALAFTALSFDEVAGVHETLNSLSEITWVVPAAIAAALFAAAYVPFLGRLPKSTRIRFIVAGLLYVAGALAVEFNTLQFLTHNDKLSFAYSVLTGSEESLEMIGTVVFLDALLRLMLVQGGEERIGVRVNAAETGSA